MPFTGVITPLTTGRGPPCIIGFDSVFRTVLLGSPVPTSDLRSLILRVDIQPNTSEDVDGPPNSYQTYFLRRYLPGCLRLRIVIATNFRSKYCTWHYDWGLCLQKSEGFFFQPRFVEMIGWRQKTLIPRHPKLHLLRFGVITGPPKNIPTSKHRSLTSGGNMTG